MAVFYSFDYDRDAFRVQQIVQMGAVEGQPLLNSQEWERVKRQTDSAIKQWIQDQMAYKSAVVVLVGAQTAASRWVDYEIRYAWDNYKPLVGIRINGLADGNGTDPAGANPFTNVKLQGGGTVGDHVNLHTPDGNTSQAVHASIRNNLLSWVNNANKRR